MYVFYEEFLDKEQKRIMLTQFVMSSFRSFPRINWKDEEEKHTCHLVGSLLKAVPSEHRDYDADTKIWSVVGDYGKSVLRTINVAISKNIAGKTVIVELSDLESRVKAKNFSDAETKVKVDTAQFESQFAEGFFHREPVSNSTALSGDELYAALSKLLNLPVEVVKTGDKKILKRAYLQSTKRLHPDLPGGDAKKMAELNSLWSIYNS